MSKNKVSRCSCCKKKLSLITFKCKCELTFCISCKMPEIHKCTYNYLSAEKLKLEKENPKIIPDKIIEI